MSKTQKDTQIININDTEYNVDDLSPEQVALVNHVMDLDRKLNSARFNVTQLEGGRMFFMNQLEIALEDNTSEGSQEDESE